MLLTSKISRAALFVVASCAFGYASAQSSGSETVYWCKHDNGAEYAQREPCAPGMEVRQGKTIPGTKGLIEGKPVRVAPVQAAPESSPPVVERSPSKAPDSSVAVSADKKDNDTLREGQMSLLKLLGFGLVFGAIAKFAGRSFWAGFIGGAVLRVVLVSLDVMKF